MLAFFAPPPLHYSLPNPGDQFRYALAYSGPSSPASGAETDTFSQGQTLGQKCLMEVAQHTTNWATHGHRQHSSTVATFWESVSPTKISFLAIALGNQRPLGLSSPGYKPPVMKPGASWTDHAGTPDLLTYRVTAKVLRRETVTVPAGTFACWVIQKTQTQTEPTQKTTYHMTCWWSPQLKYNVKSVYDMELSNGLPLGTFRYHVTQSLIAYTLAKQ
jgi:hypothetical protein